MKTLRSRLLTAFFVGLMLAALAATPIVTEVAGFDGAAHASDCGTSTC